ncbi:unnamed protein product [Amoebophrya sp. A120]|nr:unnamed protein product [Amoebophrya sp. A120]|eukprot:GSA120T00007512001.1
MATPSRSASRASSQRSSAGAGQSRTEEDCERLDACLDFLVRVVPQTIFAPCIMLTEAAAAGGGSTSSTAARNYATESERQEAELYAKVPQLLSTQSHLLIPRRRIISQAVARLTLLGRRGPQGGGGARTATTSGSEDAPLVVNEYDADEDINEALKQIATVPTLQAELWRRDPDAIPEPLQAAVLHVFLRDLVANFQRFEDESLIRRGSVGSKQTSDAVDEDGKILIAGTRPSPPPPVEVVDEQPAEDPPRAGPPAAPRRIICPPGATLIRPSEASDAVFCTRLHMSENVPAGSLLLVLEELRNKQVQAIGAYAETTENDGDGSTFVRRCGPDWLSCPEKCPNKRIYYLTTAG